MIDDNMNDDISELFQIFLKIEKWPTATTKCRKAVKVKQS